ncbi:hypothetical protein Pmani_031644 [Petrolisthes manimaculis]|uniref:Uncharacterized protein n=1 Tax=Petrolisthes manimaculis TaxID=1843537 RepID=A0AAE1NU96_9EUCA|nr:hypothetical protein Pmani_031644 [Petrolisthes manimaculis]
MWRSGRVNASSVSGAGVEEWSVRTLISLPKFTGATLVPVLEICNLKTTYNILVNLFVIVSGPLISNARYCTCLAAHTGLHAGAPSRGSGSKGQFKSPGTVQKANFNSTVKLGAVQEAWEPLEDREPFQTMIKPYTTVKLGAVHEAWIAVQEVRKAESRNRSRQTSNYGLQ